MQKIRWFSARLVTDTREKRGIAERKAVGLPYLRLAISAARVRRGDET